MHRLDIINCLIKKYNFNNYLEIGVSNGWVLNRVNAKSKIGVDPDYRIYIKQREFPIRDEIASDPGWTPLIPYGKIPANIIIIGDTSDKFFENLEPEIKFDIVFIDGLHVAEQTFRDITNSIKHLNENGIIVVHDCNPGLKEEATPIYSGGNWNGNVYLGYLDAINTYNLEYYTVDSDWGCGILFPKNVNLNVEKKSMNIDWQYFDNHRKELLNLIETTEFIKLMKFE